MSGIEVNEDLEDDIVVNDGTGGDGVAVSTGDAYKREYDSKQGDEADEVIWDKTYTRYYLSTDLDLITAYSDAKYFFVKVDNPRQLEGVSTLDPFIHVKVPMEQTDRYHNIPSRLLNQYFQEYLPSEWRDINLEDIEFVFPFQRYNYQNRYGHSSRGHVTGVLVSSKPVWTSRHPPVPKVLKRFESPLWASTSCGSGYPDSRNNTCIWVNGRAIYRNDIVIRSNANGTSSTMHDYHITREPGEWKKAQNRKKKRAESAARSRLKRGVFNITVTEGLIRASIPHQWLSLSKSWNRLSHEKRISECALILNQVERRYKAAKENSDKRDIAATALDALRWSPNITQTMKMWAKADDESIADEPLGEEKKKIAKYLVLMLKRFGPLEAAFEKEQEDRQKRMEEERKKIAREHQAEQRRKDVAAALAIQKKQGL